MKKALILMLALLLGLGAAASCAENRDGQEILPEEVQKRIETNPYLNLFDLRNAEEYAAAHIPAAASVPLSQMQRMIQDVLDAGYSYMNAEVIVYGDTEEDGIEGTRILRELGFSNVRWLKSLNDWTGKLVSTADEMRLLGNLDTVDIYGNPADASLLSGYRLTMVNVWATYCTPCVNEMGDLGKLAAEVKEQGVQIVGLLSDTMDASLCPVEEKVKLARQIAENTGADYPHLLPSSDLYWKVIGQISAVPTTFFVDETGMMVGSVYVGARDYGTWKSIIDKVLSQLN